MTLLGLIVALIIIGLLLYLVSTLPIDNTIKLIIRAVVIVAVVLLAARGARRLPGRSASTRGSGDDRPRAPPRRGSRPK